MIQKIYKWMWGNTTHRPWTYVWRQTMQEEGWKVILAHVFIYGLIATPIVMWFGWLAFAFAFAIWFAGFLDGHLYWDTPGKHVKHEEYFNDGSGGAW